MTKPKLIKAGDERVFLNGEPPKVDCRVVAEELYQRMESGQHETLVIGKHLVRASIWYINHQKYVDRIVFEIESKYPPTDSYDVRNPNVWKPEHWKWFIEEYL